MVREATMPSALSDKTAWYLNKELISLFIYASSCAAVNPYKNIFGIKIVGLPEIWYGLIMFASGLMITLFSLYFGVKADKHGSFSKIIMLCCCCGVAGNLAVFFWPTMTVFLLANCLLLPAFYGVNSLIYGLSAAKSRADDAAVRLKSNTLLRSSYSFAYVLTLGGIGLIALEKQQLSYLWLYSAVLAAIILFIFASAKTTVREQNITATTYSLKEFFNRHNCIRILAVSCLTNLLFTMDAATPLIIVDQLRSSYSTIGLFEAAIALCEVVFIFLWFALTARFAVKWLLTFGALVFSAGLIGLSLVETEFALYCTVPILAVGAACLISLPIGYFQALAPDKPGLGGSLIAVNFFLSSTISSLLYATGFYLFDVRGYIWLSVLAATIGAMILVVGWGQGSG
jgi:MFS family permease